MKPTVSVIIPTYNAARYITEAVESVLAQTHPPTEILIIDDGSTDDTEGRLWQYRGRIRYIYQQNQGVASARNRGLREARGDLIAFLDADDVWHPEKLRWQLMVFAQRPDLGAVSTESFDWPGTRYARSTPADTQASVTLISWPKLVIRNCLTTSAMAVRSEVLKAVGPFDTQLQGPEDFDLWLRIAEVTKIGVLNVPLTGYRDSPGSVSKHTDRMIRDKYKMLLKLDDRSAWGGRRLLRRKAYSFANYSGFLAFREAGKQGAAIRCLLRSCAWYPFPYTRPDTSVSFPRIKGLTLALLRWAGLQNSPSRPPQHVAEYHGHPNMPAAGGEVSGLRAPSIDQSITASR
jgi:glycosyltransferase involved in cell wall biosynthesis